MLEAIGLKLNPASVVALGARAAARSRAKRRSPSYRVSMSPDGVQGHAK